MAKIIAELCQNHNGDVNILEEMVHSASENGADFVKIQSMHSSELTHRLRFDNGLIEGGIIKVLKRPFKNEFDRLQKLDLDIEQHIKFLDFCKKYKIKPLTTIFTLSKVDIIEKLKFTSIKIASFDCASHRLIEEVSKKKFEHIIVSTGATYNREIEKTSKILKKYNKKFTLLHCVSIYPTPIEHANILRINYLKNFSSSVGISDHSNPDINKNLIPAISFYQGIDYIEKHFTILAKDKTKDGPVSVNPEQLKEMCELNKLNKKDLEKYINSNIKDHKVALGVENRDMSHVELLNRDYYQGRFASLDKKGNYIFNWQENE